MAARIQLVPGTLFAGDFRVVRALAEGGMGAVYVAHQASTGHARALKIMHPHYAADEAARQRFRQEAQVGARIASDHVVQVVAAGVDDVRGTPWLAMELLEGQDLFDAMVQRGRLGPAAVLELFEQLCHALAAAHAQGLVHRDLKPENVFLAEPRRPGVPFTVKVLDFGIAKVIDEHRTSATASAAIGTPYWQAPEQVLERGRIAPATDVWALGLIAFFLLTGRYYWLAANEEGAGPWRLVYEMGEDAPEPPSRRAALWDLAALVPPGFDAWFARCVVRDAGQRFRDAGEAMAALRPVLAGFVASHDALPPEPARASTSPLATAPTVVPSAAAATGGEPLPPPAVTLAPTVAVAMPAASPSRVRRALVLGALGLASGLATAVACNVVGFGVLVAPGVLFGAALGVGLRRAGLLRGGVAGFAIGACGAWCAALGALAVTVVPLVLAAMASGGEAADVTRAVQEQAGTLGTLVLAAAAVGSAALAGWVAWRAPALRGGRAVALALGGTALGTLPLALDAAHGAGSLGATALVFGTWQAGFAAFVGALARR